MLFADGDKLTKFAGRALEVAASSRQAKIRSGLRKSFGFAEEDALDAEAKLVAMSEDRICNLCAVDVGAIGRAGVAEMIPARDKEESAWWLETDGSSICRMLCASLPIVTFSSPRSKLIRLSSERKI